MDLRRIEKMIEFLAEFLGEYVHPIFLLLVILSASILIGAVFWLFITMNFMEDTEDKIEDRRTHQEILLCLAAGFSMFSTGLLMLLFAVYIYVEFIR